MVAGAVVAAHAGAARAGAHVLRAGGNAVDAAVATAAALSVVDPANCGLGGYGGFMIVSTPQGAEQLAFNTRIPAAFDPGSLAQARRAGPFVHGAVSVSLPAVLAGVTGAHARWGRLPLADLLAPAISLADAGFPVGADLAASLAWAEKNHRGLSPAFRSIFFRDGRPLPAGSTLAQPELGQTLRLIAQQGEAASREGPLVDAICEAVGEGGGALAPGDFRSYRPHAGEAERAHFRGAGVRGPVASESGFGVLAGCLVRLDAEELGANRAEGYARVVLSALSGAWRAQREAHRLLIAPAQQTNHFCTADAAGMVVSCTFTHGPLWFGSGCVAPGTGMLLNCGANLYARRHADGALVALTNLTPVVVETADGGRHAIGSPGGVRIPAIVLQAVLDIVAYGLAPQHALALPRLSVDGKGRAEAEAALVEALPALELRQIRTPDYYGPATGLSVAPDGTLRPARDSRFGAEVAYA